MNIDLKTGLQRYDISDEAGPLGTIWFNPSDPGLVSRLHEAEKKLRAVSAQLTNDPESLAAAEQAVAQMLDEVFHTEVSKTLCSHVSALAVCEDGSLLIEHIFRALAPEIARAREAAEKAQQERVSKHTGAYMADPGLGLAPGQQ